MSGWAQSCYMHHIGWARSCNGQMITLSQPILQRLMLDMDTLCEKKDGEDLAGRAEMTVEGERAKRLWDLERNSDNPAARR